MERYRDVGGCWRKDNSNYIRSSIASGTDNIAFPAEGEEEKKKTRQRQQQHKNKPIKDRGGFTVLPMRSCCSAVTHRGKHAAKRTPTRT